MEKHLSSQGRFHLPSRFLSDRQVKYLTGCCDFILSTRYHGLVFALSSGVACVGLVQDEYTDVKLRGAFALSGASECVVDVGDPELDRKVLGFWGARSTLQAAIARSRQKTVDCIDEYRKVLAQVVRKLVHNGSESPRAAREAFGVGQESSKAESDHQIPE